MHFVYFGLLLCGLHLGISADQPRETAPLSIWSRAFLTVRDNKDENQALSLAFGGIAVGIQCTVSILGMMHQTSTKVDVLETSLKAERELRESDLKAERELRESDLKAKGELWAQQKAKLESDLKAERELRAQQKAKLESDLKAERELRESDNKVHAVQLKAEQELREESVKRAKAEAVKDVLQMLGQEQYSQLMIQLLNSSKAG